MHTDTGKPRFCKCLTRMETCKTHSCLQGKSEIHLAASTDVPPGEGGTGEGHHANLCLPACWSEPKLPASPGSLEQFASKRVGNWSFIEKPRASAVQSAGGGCCSRYGGVPGKTIRSCCFSCLPTRDSQQRWNMAIYSLRRAANISALNLGAQPAWRHTGCRCG